MTHSRWFPQNRELVGEFEVLLRRHVREVVDYTNAFHERWKEKGVTTLRGTGWALRPFLVPASRLDFVAAAFQMSITLLRNYIRDRAIPRGDVYRLLPFHPEFQNCVHLPDGLWSPAFTSYFRPDGFLYEDQFVLSEINYGNGILVSCGYTEAVHDYWRSHPVIRRLRWDVDRLHRRPLPWLLHLFRRFARPASCPNVAMVAHSEEWKTIQTFPPRVIQQMNFVRDQILAAGMKAQIVTHEEIDVDRNGQPHLTGTGEQVDLIVFITVGTTFFDHPHLLAAGGPLHRLGQAKIGDTWVLKPLAGLIVDKGALPLLQHLNGIRTDHDGFRFTVAHTEYPAEKGPSRYIENRESWVIKRAFDGKDTHPGIVRQAGEWKAIVQRAAGDFRYVAQEYQSLPTADVPVLVDDQHLEWISSRVELSSFIYDGVFAGGGARHAPDGEGLVMTDFPKDYGYTTVFST